MIVALRGLHLLKFSLKGVRTKSASTQSLTAEQHLLSAVREGGEGTREVLELFVLWDSACC